MSDTAVPFNAERLISLGRVSAVVPSPCGTWVAVAVARLDKDGSKYVSDLWRVPLDGGAPVRLTRSDANDSAPAFRGDGALAFLSNRNPRVGKEDEGDSERSQVWIFPAEGGEARPLTDEPLGVSSFRFPRSGPGLFVVAEVLPGVAHADQRSRAQELKKHGPTALRYDRMPARVWDHWLGPSAPHLIAYSADGTDRRDLTPDADREYREAEWDVSRDGRTLALPRAVPSDDRLDDHPLYLLDVESGEMRQIASGRHTSCGSPLFSPDGARLAYVRHTRVNAVGKPELWVLDLATGSERRLAAEWDRWPHPYAWTEDGAALLVTADDRGTVPVFRIDVESGSVTRLTSPAAGGAHEGLAVVPGKDLLVGIRHRTAQPPEPFRLSASAPGHPRLLAGLSGITDAEAGLVVWESISTPAPDDAPVQTWVLRPATWQPGDAPLPLLIWIHGGPIGQWSEGWHWRWNPLTAVARGYAVALPNPRGSTGCGQEFVEGIWGNAWGGACYHDLMAVADALESLPYVDAQRVCAMGGSFGGYMTNWIGVNTDRFRCLVNHAGLYHLPMFHGTTDFPVWFARNIGAFPWEAPDAYDLYSPHRRIANWRTPVLIIHGERDYRVPIGEALALFEGLQHHGVPSELLVFPDENHWILRPRNIVQWYGSLFQFIDGHLHPSSDPVPAG